MSMIKRMVLSALCIALCVVLPIAFHVIPNAGSVFLPMHIPVLLCGLVCGWQYGLLCGVMGPLVSSVLTGMPAAAILPSMIVECGVYGCTAGLMMEYIRTGRLSSDLYLCLPTAMLVGRIRMGNGKFCHRSARYSGSADFHSRNRRYPDACRSDSLQI